MTAQFLSNSVKYFAAAVAGGAYGSENSLKPRSEDDFLMPLFYSLGLRLCNKTPSLAVYSVASRRFDLPLIPHPDALSYILINIPYVHHPPCFIGTVAELWPPQNPCMQEIYNHTHEMQYVITRFTNGRTNGNMTLFCAP